LLQPLVFGKVMKKDRRLTNRGDTPDDALLCNPAQSSVMRCSIEELSPASVFKDGPSFRKDPTFVNCAQHRDISQYSRTDLVRIIRGSPFRRGLSYFYWDWPRALSMDTESSRRQNVFPTETKVWAGNTL
jgi:hypothetical protein